MGLLAFILYFFLFVIIFMLLAGFFLLSGLVGGVANIFRLFQLNKAVGQAQNRKRTSRGARSTSYSSSSRASDAQTNSASNGKIFGADEGVYVDFEEVKE